MKMFKRSWLLLLVFSVCFILAGCARQGGCPKVTIIIAEPEYETDVTVPKFAREVLEAKHGIKADILIGDMENPHYLEGMAESIENADVLILSVRRQAYPKADLDAVREHLNKGKPLVAIRTSSHAFDAKGKAPEGAAEWLLFDQEVLGCDYAGHYGNDLKSKITITKGAKGHPILKGVKGFVSNGSLYKSNPLGENTMSLLTGKVEGEAPEPVAWTNTYKEAKIFYTSLGHPDDFDEPSFCRLLENAIFWALEK